MKTDNEFQENWFRLDSSADLYPMSITATTQSIFRLGVELDTFVDEDILKDALAAIMPRYPSFCVQLRKGMFRYYFDQNNLPPPVEQYNGIFFQKINFIRNNRHLFRVTYYKNKIFVDFFHGMTDASGGMEFLRSLVFQYFMEAGLKPVNDGTVKFPGQPIPDGELEDAFQTHYKKYNLFGGVIGKMAGQNALPQTGKRFFRIGYGLIEGYLPADQLKSAAKRHECTVTAFLVAALMVSIAEVYGMGYQKYDLVAMVPVNLRRFFPSETLSNFTSLVRCQINTNVTPLNIESYVGFVKRQMQEQLTAEGLNERLSFSAFMGAKWYMKILPRGLKTFFTRAGKFLSYKTKQTVILSNLGVVKMPYGAAQHIRKFSFNSNISHKIPRNVGVVTYGNVTTVSFTRKLVSTEVERVFFRRLHEQGIDPIEVASNLRESK